MCRPADVHGCGLNIFIRAPIRYGDSFRIIEEALLSVYVANMGGREPSLRLQGERSDVFTPFCGINT